MPRQLKRLILGIFAGLLFAPLAASAQVVDAPARFTAAAVDLNRGAAGTLEFVVNRWSSDADRDRLLQVMFDQGPEKLLDALKDMPRMGYIRTPGRVGWDIRFAHHVAEPDGGEKILIITDRQMSFREVANRPRSFDYPFTVIEVRLDRSGDDGDGKAMIATRIFGDRDKREMTLENFDISPVTLTKVKKS
jgi:hypothetical protein